MLDGGDGCQLLSGYNDLDRFTSCRYSGSKGCDQDKSPTARTKSEEAIREMYTSSNTVLTGPGLLEFPIASFCGQGGAGAGG
jgi:hypothetical protein